MLMMIGMMIPMTTMMIPDHDPNHPQTYFHRHVMTIMNVIIIKYHYSHDDDDDEWDVDWDENAYDA